MTAAPLVVEAAINGATTRRRNPHVPLTVEELAADALACFDAGAAIVHHHVEPDLRGDDAASRYLQVWEMVWAERPDALLYPTLPLEPDGTPHTGHLPALAAAGMVVAPCDPGSVNLGRVVDGVPDGDFVYRTSFAETARQLALLAELGVGPSFGIYEPGYLRTVGAWWRAGRLPPGAMVKLYFADDAGLTGTPFGLPPTPAALALYVDMLAGVPLPWAVSLAGGDVVGSGLAAMAVRLGGHVHVGLEFHRGGTPTNVELVRRAVEVGEWCGRPPASCAEARTLLGIA